MDGVDVRVVVGVVDGEKVEQGGSGSELSISGIILEKEHNWLNSLMFTLMMLQPVLLDFSQQQALAGSRDFQLIKILGFLKIKSRDFSGFGIAQKTMFTKTFICFQTASGSFLYSQNLSKCF